jgi:prepilin-type N-terminal cleavage/methylation domain-containing protein
MKSLAHLHADSPPKNISVRRAAFTLTEMLVVIGIIVVLIALLATFIGWFNRRGQESVAMADIQQISVALEAYKIDQGYYPFTPKTFSASSTTLDYTNNVSSNNNALYRALVLQPSGIGTLTATGMTVKKSPYLTHLRPTQLSGLALAEDTQLVDPWKRPYQYDAHSPFPGVRRNPTFDLWSMGRDGFTSNRRRGDEPNDYDNDDIGNCYPP